ncbi:DsbA family protein [Mycolicibacterium sp.]|uniref:DsbA family protein n=1 Tax=Mycolicibacterium sp. TaxID=2320850 RepID=UPI003D0A82FD
MRTRKPALILTVLALLLAVAGCSTEIAGTPTADPTPAPLGVAGDGYGIVAGFDDAPARIEIFTEPQCSHCRDLQSEYGDQLASYVKAGTLQVTYRPLTFLDDGPDGYSATVANALFAAADPSGDFAVTGTQFQHFVEELWLNQDPGGVPFSGDELRDMALRAGLPDGIADNIASLDEAVDTAEMGEANFTYLYEIDPLQTGTPTVFDLVTEEKVDIYSDDWLEQLLRS